LEKFGRRNSVRVAEGFKTFELKVVNDLRDVEFTELY